jgi:hypothetical protein
MFENLGKKYSFMYLNIVCAHAKFHEILTFLWPVQKDKKKPHEGAYFRTKVCVFYKGRTKGRFFLK